MNYSRIMKKAILIEIILLIIAATVVVRQTERTRTIVTSGDGEYIKWVDFTVSYEALCKAYEWDVNTYDSGNHVDWIELLAYTAAKTGGEFHKKALSTLNQTASEIADGKTNIRKLTKDLKYYEYYYEAYEAVLGGLVGEFEEEWEDENGEVIFRQAYGLKGYFPLARGFTYNHYDDFGAGRSFGYDRKHLGHDMMGQIGTPIGMINRIESHTCTLNRISYLHFELLDRYCRKSYDSKR